jgi:hypothetical protein
MALEFDPDEFAIVTNPLPAFAVTIPPLPILSWPLLLSPTVSSPVMSRLLAPTERLLLICPELSITNALASGLTPPWNHRFLDRAEIILRNADTPSGSFIAAALAPQTPQAFPVPGLPPRAPPPTPPTPPTMQRPRTVPRMAAVQQVTRDYVGPLGDLLVRRAIESTGTDLNDAASAERLIDVIAQQLPEHKRPRFRAESKAALEAAGREPGSQPGSERTDDSSGDLPESQR